MEKVVTGAFLVAWSLVLAAIGASVTTLLAYYLMIAFVFDVWEIQ